MRPSSTSQRSTITSRRTREPTADTQDDRTSTRQFLGTKGPFVTRSAQETRPEHPSQTCCWGSDPCNSPPSDRAQRITQIVNLCLIPLPSSLPCVPSHSNQLPMRPPSPSTIRAVLRQRMCAQDGGPSVTTHSHLSGPPFRTARTSPTAPLTSPTPALPILRPSNIERSGTEHIGSNQLHSSPTLCHPNSLQAPTTRREGVTWEAPR